MASRPFLTRLIPPFAVLLILIVAVCGGVVYWTGEQVARHQQFEDLVRVGNLVREPILSNKPGELPHLAEALAVRITVLDRDGQVVSDTNASVNEPRDNNKSPEVVQARSERVGWAVHSGPGGEQSIYVAELVDPQKGTVMRLSYPQHVVSTLGPAVLQVVAGAAAASLLSLALLALVLQREWIAPTRRLSAAAERMADGHWDCRADPTGAEELRSFSTRLNLVASHAQKQMADLTHQRADLQALVDTLPDPILVSDSAGKLILINQPAARLLDLPKSRAIGEPFVHVVNLEAVLQLFDRVREIATVPPAGGDAQTLTKEIRLTRNGQRHSYQAVGTRTARGGVLLVLRDVGALKHAMQMKTDFVANASHELRTPISAIKIAFETLREVYGEDPHQSERCMQIIDGHLKRLEEMLRDLLDLSKVERENLELNVRELKTLDIFNHLRSSLGPMARQKVVELSLGDDADAQPQTLLADEVLLHLVLKNLVENSIKFTPTGGSIFVTLRRAPDGSVEPGSVPPLLLSVMDTGIGIPPEHLERVFERFYQVDPARSGSAGRGTGLGLAIVKHAVAAMGGNLQIESTVGVGTTVTCILPQDKAAQTDEDDLAEPAAVESAMTQPGPMV